MIVAIDGPAGAGKSTVAREIARRRGFQLVDTGAMYRAVALKAAEAGVDLHDQEAVSEVASALNFEFRFVGDENVTFCDDQQLAQEIRTAQVSRDASIVSAHPEVRRVLVDLQRQVGKARSSVLEGRDIGTVVFPDADLKLYITASAPIRARRRVEQMNDEGQKASYERVLKEIVERDRRDMEREFSPLEKAQDAVEIDTSTMPIEEVIQRVEDLLVSADSS